MLETKDLILKAAEFEDWRDLYENIWSRRESAKYMLWKPTCSEEEARARMERTLAWQQKNELSYTVYEKKSGRAIGFAGMTRIQEDVYEDTGIAVGPDYVGRGYGKQILQALTKQAFEELNAERFVCSCREKNVASKAMQLSCGFSYTHSEDRTDPNTGEAYVLDFYELILPAIRRPPQG